MSTTDLVPDVTDYLVAQCQASAALKALGVQVFDGPVPPADATGVEQCLWIGCDPKNPGGEYGTSTQSFAYIGNDATRRNQAGDITCAAKHWTGDTSSKVHRDGCKAITAVVEELLRGVPPAGPGDTTMGGLVQWSEFAESAWYADLVPGGGAEAVCVFKIYFYVRLS